MFPPLVAPLWLFAHVQLFFFNSQSFSLFSAIAFGDFILFVKAFKDDCLLLKVAIKLTANFTFYSQSPRAVWSVISYGKFS